jgi:hypothetical protein
MPFDLLKIVLLITYLAQQFPLLLNLMLLTLRWLILWLQQLLLPLPLLLRGLPQPEPVLPLAPQFLLRLGRVL